VVIYHWLKARFPKADIEGAWVSENRSILTGVRGNDGLGYDFELTYQRQRWYIEVKASTSDQGTFLLGETEVRKAREVARARSNERYIVAVVSNVGSPGGVQIDLLPNPMGPDADGVIELLGEGLRYRYRRVTA
jgi:opacity protein-like surface antigen